MQAIAEPLNEFGDEQNGLKSRDESDAAVCFRTAHNREYSDV
jgi:hypothetical protein